MLCARAILNFSFPDIGAESKSEIATQQVQSSFELDSYKSFERKCFVIYNQYIVWTIHSNYQSSNQQSFDLRFQVGVTLITLLFKFKYFSFPSTNLSSLTDINWQFESNQFSTGAMAHFKERLC